MATHPPAACLPTEAGARPASAYLVDLHVHSHYAWATSRHCTVPEYWKAAQRKGVRVIGTGDITHPGWLQELRAQLRPAANGLWELAPESVQEHAREVPRRCRAPVYFLLSGEVNCVYRAQGRSRRVHHLIYLSALDRAQALQDRLQPFGHLARDGRPTLKLDSRDLLEILLDADPESALVPAHIWTPWYSLLGRRSGFDSLAECFRDLTPEVRAVETGLSATPDMMKRVDFLKPLRFLSGSDAHAPDKVGREATQLAGQPTFASLGNLLKGRGSVEPRLTLEWPPNMGKYYWDGHRKCRVAWSPAASAQRAQICPACRRPVTEGVLSRIETLSRSDETPRPTAPARINFPLRDLIAQALQRGPNTQAVSRHYVALLQQLGSELPVVHAMPLEAIAAAATPAIAQAVRAARQGNLTVEPGFDGQFGSFHIRQAPADQTIAGPRQNRKATPERKRLGIGS